MKNKFQDGQTVRLKSTNEILTVAEWGYVPRMREFTYTVLERPSTFFFENELEEVNRLKLGEERTHVFLLQITKKPEQS